MIISHRHRFIFLKTNKTAGTSVEIALSGICGEEDIITPISPEDEEKRQALGFPGPQNHLEPLWRYRPVELSRRLRKGKKKLRFYNHMTASEVKARIGEDVWNSYYKFCFERNPWDRVLSLYYWRTRSGPSRSLPEFIASDEIFLLKKGGWGVYTIDDQVVVDKVCRFEALEEELDEFCRLKGIAELPRLTRAKSGTRKDRRSYREVLSPLQRDRIADAFRDEIDLMGYQWGDTPRSLLQSTGQKANASTRNDG